jgi:DNA-binding NarL/FixJ family response regulator
MRKLRILIVDDHALVRRGAREVLNSEQGWRVVGEAADGLEAVQKAVALKPDVAIVDLSMPSLNGVEVTRRIGSAVPVTKVLVLTMDESDQMVRRALEAGARGYVLKSDLTDCLPKAVRAIAEGKRFLTPKVSEIVLDVFLNGKERHGNTRREGVSLGPRELEVVRLLGEGKTNKEIAGVLQIAVRTVETHRSHIMHKLDLHSVVELVRYGLSHGITTTQGG